MTDLEARRKDFKQYQVTWPDGQVSTFSLSKEGSGTFGEESIKKLLSLPHKTTGKVMKLVKVKRTK